MKLIKSDPTREQYTQSDNGFELNQSTSSLGNVSRDFSSDEEIARKNPNESNVQPES